MLREDVAFLQAEGEANGFCDDQLALHKEERVGETTAPAEDVIDNIQRIIVVVHCEATALG